MTLNEQKRFAEKFMARRTSRIVGLQNGYAEFAKNLADPYNSGTLEETADSSNGEPVDTSRIDNVGDSDWQGSVPREGGDSDPAWKSDLRNAITSIQRAVENGGRGLDVNTVAGLNLLASAAQKLVELPEGVAVPKASPNPEGTTREPLRVADNTASQNAGSHG